MPDDKESPLDLCVCGHTRASHAESGHCDICESNVQNCPSFWSQQEYTDAVLSAQVRIVQATKAFGTNNTKPA